MHNKNRCFIMMFHNDRCVFTKSYCLETSEFYLHTINYSDLSDGESYIELDEPNQILVKKTLGEDEVQLECSDPEKLLDCL